MTAPLAATTDPDQLLCRIAGIGDLFAIEGEFVTGKEIPSGHINTTYKATYRKSDGTEDSYILQRINDYVFKDPRAVMRNVEKVTRHINWKVLRRLKDSAGQTLNLYPARGGRNYIDIPGDGIWRCYNYLAGTHTYDVVENTRQAYQAGFAFGSFQDLISDMNPDDIVETIPGFHHTRNRFNRLMEVAAQDPQERLSTCLPELDFIKAREQDVDRLLDLQASGVLPTRITHNDTKINNVMLDEDTDHAVCVIDLDTVMPGLVLYDFGDMVRTVTPPTEEDEEDLDQDAHAPCRCSIHCGRVSGRRPGLPDPGGNRPACFLRKTHHAGNRHPVPDGLPGRRPILQGFPSGPQPHPLPHAAQAGGMH